MGGTSNSYIGTGNIYQKSPSRPMFSCMTTFRWSILSLIACFYIIWLVRPSSREVIYLDMPDRIPNINLDFKPPPPAAPTTPPPAAPTTPPPVAINTSKDAFSVADRGFWQGLGSVKGHLFDSKLAEALLDFFKTEELTSLLELGAGTGAYAKLFKSAGIFISCYDGNPNTQDLSEGRCAIIDLSKPIDLCKHDWVLSLEVGEHIPKEFEEIFISNLDFGNQKGIILSWAVEGQGGTSHVNTRNNTYIRERITSKGYNSDFETEKTLRTAASLGWFKSTLMVFRKQ